MEWVGRGEIVGGERRQEWRRLDLEDLRNCRTGHQGGICFKRQITMLSRLDDIFDFKFRQLVPARKYVMVKPHRRGGRPAPMESC